MVVDERKFQDTHKAIEDIQTTRASSLKALALEITITAEENMDNHAEVEDLTDTSLALVASKMNTMRHTDVIITTQDISLDELHFDNGTKDGSKKKISYNYSTVEDGSKYNADTHIQIM